MVKYVLLPLGNAGFGASISNRMWCMENADRLGRKWSAFLYQHYYDDPFDYDCDWREVGAPSGFVTPTGALGRVAAFDMQLLTTYPPRGAQDSGLRERAQLISRLKLKPHYRSYLDQFLARHPQIQDAVALHIRRGDKSVDRAYTPLRDLVDAAVAQCRTLGCAHVFLNSDSQEALSEASAMLQAEGLTPFSDESEVRYNNANWKMTQDDARLRRQETETGVKIIYSMSRCRALVGEGDIHFVKLAAAHGVFLHGVDFPRTLIQPDREVYKHVERTSRISFREHALNLRGVLRRVAKYREVYRQRLAESRGSQPAESMMEC